MKDWWTSCQLWWGHRIPVCGCLSRTRDRTRKT
ncbi:MAG: hypothetical protein IPI86_14200 [Anaerolineales bacterium]|nr:hypothetical protein [Anaerolineales bacterium]